MHQVREPLPTSRVMLGMLGLFPVAGVLFVGPILADGAGVFGLVWFALFAGIPSALLVHTLRGRGVRGFALSEDGIHGAADREDRLVAWDEVHELRWQPTGTTVNDQELVALFAVTPTGDVRISSRAGDRKRFVLPVEERLRATGVVPAGLLGPPSAGRVSGGSLGAPGRPPSDAVLGDPFAGIPHGPGLDELPPPPPSSWPDAEQPAAPDPGELDEPFWPSSD